MSCCYGFVHAYFSLYVFADVDSQDLHISLIDLWICSCTFQFLLRSRVFVKDMDICRLFLIIPSWNFFIYIIAIDLHFFTHACIIFCHWFCSFMTFHIHELIPSCKYVYPIFMVACCRFNFVLIVFLAMKLASRIIYM